MHQCYIYLTRLFTYKHGWHVLCGWLGQTMGKTWCRLCKLDLYSSTKHLSSKTIMLKNTGLISTSTLSSLQTRPITIHMFAQHNLPEYILSRRHFLFHPSHKYFSPTDPRIDIIEICWLTTCFMLVWGANQDGTDDGSQWSNRQSCSIKPHVANR